jgi:hypothetical protein
MNVPFRRNGTFFFWRAGSWLVRASAWHELTFS